MQEYNDCSKQEDDMNRLMNCMGENAVVASNYLAKVTSSKKK